MSTSTFYRTMSKKTDAELKAIVKDMEGYLPEAREVAENILRERKVDIILEDIPETTEVPEDKPEETSERLFYVNWEAPSIVIFIGFGLYFLLGLSFYFNMREETVVTINGRIVFRYVAALIIYFAFAILIDGIIKGKVWVRATYTGLVGLGLLWKLTVYILNPYIFPPMLDVALMLIELTLIALLFVQPASNWFVRKEKKINEDLLDDI